MKNWMVGTALICAMLVSTDAAGVESSERFKRVEIASRTSARFSALAIHPSVRKLFAAQGTDNPLETGLWVFDIDRLGDLTSSDERSYPLLPPAGKPTRDLRIYCLRFSPDGRKLYLGVMDRENGKGLVVRDLDEKGEPVGKPRSYGPAAANSIQVHPKGEYLYTGAGLAFPLVKGEPSGEPAQFTAGNWSMVPSDAWDALIVGGYPSAIRVLDVGATGEMEKPLAGDRTFRASNSLATLQLFRVGRTLYFAAENILFSWSLDKSWQPAGKPCRYPEIHPVSNGMNGASQIAATSNNLYVAHGEFVTNETTRKSELKGIRILEFKPDPQGDPGKPILESPLFPSCSSLVVDERSGSIYFSP